MSTQEPKAPKRPTINLRKATLQRIYEFALRHVRKQGKASVIGGTCVYRGHDGAMCAVGAMLTDEQIAIAGLRNSASVEQHRDKFVPLVGPKAGRKLALLQALQRAHDSAGDEYFLRDFEDNMRGVAARFGLSYKPPGTTLRA